MAKKEEVLKRIETGNLDTKALARIVKQSTVSEVQIAAMQKIDWSIVDNPQLKIITKLFLNRKTTTPFLVALKKSGLTNKEIVAFISDYKINFYGQEAYDFLSQDSSFDDLFSFAQELNERNFWSQVEKFPKFDDIGSEELNRIIDLSVKKFEYFDGWETFIATGKLSLDTMLEAYMAFPYWERSHAIVTGLGKMNVSTSDARKYHSLFEKVNGDHAHGEILTALSKKINGGERDGIFGSTGKFGMLIFILCDGPGMNNLFPEDDAVDLSNGAKSIPDDVTNARREGKTVIFVPTENPHYWKMPDGTKIYEK